VDIQPLYRFGSKTGYGGYEWTQTDTALRQDSLKVIYVRCSL